MSVKSENCFVKFHCTQTDFFDHLSLIFNDLPTKSFRNENRNVQVHLLAVSIAILKEPIVNQLIRSLISYS